MQRENKWQERFQEEFKNYPFETLEEATVKLFIQSEIDRAVAEEGERINKEWCDRFNLCYKCYEQHTLTQGCELPIINEKQI